MTDSIPRPASRISIPALLIHTAFAVALVNLLQVQLSSNARLQSPSPVPGVELISKIDRLIATAAGGRGVELHLNVSPQDWTQNASFLTRIYFSAVYHQYPSPVLIGNGRATINFPADLQKADQVASDAWLSQHGIHSVITLIPGDQTGWQALIHPVP